MTLESEKQLAEVATMVRELKHFLLGNGKPGVIDEHKRRIEWLERIVWIVIGIVVADGGTHIIAAVIK